MPHAGRPGRLFNSHGVVESVAHALGTRQVYEAAELDRAGVPVEEISRLVGHSGTTVTELVFRHQLKPVIQTGATVMDRLFGSEPR
jgi:hypothetical protein